LQRGKEDLEPTILDLVGVEDASIPGALVGVDLTRGETVVVPAIGQCSMVGTAEVVIHGAIARDVHCGVTAEVPEATFQIRPATVPEARELRWTRIGVLQEPLLSGLPHLSVEVIRLGDAVDADHCPTAPVETSQRGQKGS